MKGQCKLCAKNEELLKSHIIPSFVFRRLKRKSATGRISAAEKPNKPVQDGYKPYFLCFACEKLFNAWETKFAQQIFHPFSDELKNIVPYDSWLLKFCVSISWRILTYSIEQDIVPHFSEKLLQKARIAQTVWREFLLGQRENPAQYEQHFIPFSPFKEVPSYKYANLPTNINRYILGSVAMDVICNRKEAYVYAKLGQLVIVGFIHTENPKHWIETKVHMKRGVIRPEIRQVPVEFSRYFERKANDKKAFQAQISERQRKTILDICKKDLPRVMASEAYKAMFYDYQMFGEEVFRD